MDMTPESILRNRILDIKDCQTRVRIPFTKDLIRVESRATCAAAKRLGRKQCAHAIYKDKPEECLTDNRQFSDTAVMIPAVFSFGTYPTIARVQLSR